MSLKLTDSGKPIVNHPLVLKNLLLNFKFQDLSPYFRFRYSRGSPNSLLEGFDFLGNENSRKSQFTSK